MSIRVSNVSIFSKNSTNFKCFISLGGGNYYEFRKQTHRRICAFSLTHIKYEFTRLSGVLYCCSITVVCIFPHPSTPPHPSPLPSPASNPPLDFVHVSFIVAPVNPSPHYPLPIPLWVLLDCS